MTSHTRLLVRTQSHKPKGSAVSSSYRRRMTMPLPEEHVRPLLEDLQIHERRLAFLEDQMRLLSSEAEYHRQLLALGRDPRLLRMLSAVLDDQELAVAATEDPSGFLQREGLLLPNGVAVHLT